MVALSEYLTDTELLLNDVAGVIYTPAELTGYINKARNQIAGSSETARCLGALSTVGGTFNYLLTAITLVTGFSLVINVRSAMRAGNSLIDILSWERFHDNNYATTITQGPPKVAAIYNPGTGGQLYISPTPDAIYPLTLDCVCLPTGLSSPTDLDLAIGFPWTDAVGYYAAHLALLRTGRIADARAMFEMYQLFERRAVEITGASRTIDSYSPVIGQELAAARHPLTQSGQSGSGAQRGGR